MDYICSFHIFVSTVYYQPATFVQYEIHVPLLCLVVDLGGGVKVGVQAKLTRTSDGSRAGILI